MKKSVLISKERGLTTLKEGTNHLCMHLILELSFFILMPVQGCAKTYLIYSI